MKTWTTADYPYYQVINKDDKAIWHGKSVASYYGYRGPECHLYYHYYGYDGKLYVKRIAWNCVSSGTGKETQTMENPCPGCNGKGTYQFLGPVMTCDQCQGTGHKPPPIQIIEDDEIPF